MPSEQSHPQYVPAISGPVAAGSILYSSAQALSDSQKSQARANMGLGSASVMDAAGVSATANSSQLVRGDDLRWGILSTAAQTAGGKLLTSQLPEQATMVSVTVADQAARLALNVASSLGKVIYQADTGVSYVLKPGGVSANLADWNAIGGSVHYGSINGLSVFMSGFLAAADQAAAKTAMALANLRDQPTTPHVIVEGNLVLNGQSANTFTLDASALSAPFAMRAPYRSGPGVFYPAISTNLDGSLDVDDITGLPAALAGKADLVGGKVPLSQLPAIVGSLTSSVSVPNALARLAMTSTEAQGVIVVQADDKTSWMLKSGGVPSVPLDWNQVGDTEVRVEEIVNAGVAGQQLLLAEDAQQARDVMGMGEAEAITFDSVYLSSGLLHFQISTGVFKSLNKPTTMTGSGWTLPNRSGFLAYSPNADGSLNGSDIAGGSPIFFGVTTGTIVHTGIHTRNPGASDRWLSGAFSATQTVATLTSNRTHTFPNGTGTLALVTSSSGVIAQTDVAGLTTVLAAKASLVGGKVPTSQLPAITLTSSKVVADQSARLGLDAADAQGFIIVEADTGDSYMLVDAGSPSVTGDWVQVGDRSVTAAEISNATAEGIVLLTGNLSAQLDALAHKARHVAGGADALEAAKLAVAYVPSNYVRDASHRPSGVIEELGSHLKGIDNKMAVSNAALQAQVTALTASLTSANEDIAALEAEVNDLQTLTANIEVVTLGEDEDFTLTSGFATVPNMSFEVVAGKVYHFTFTFKIAHSSGSPIVQVIDGSTPIPTTPSTLTGTIAGVQHLVGIYKPAASSVVELQVILGSVTSLTVYANPIMTVRTITP